LVSFIPTLVDKMSRRSITGGGLAAALLIATPFIASHEGKRNDPYLDIAKVPSVCYGVDQWEGFERAVEIYDAFQ